MRGLLGFLIHPTYRIEGDRPVVQLYGRLETGETFLVRDGRQRPRFYVRAADRALAERLGAWPLAPAGRVTMAGEPVLLVEVPLPRDVPPLRQRLEGAGLRTYEADVRFALRGLIDRNIRGALRIAGPSRPGRGPDGGGVDRVFDDPELGPAEFAPELSALSLDIETDPREGRLLSLALWGCGAGEVLVVVPPGGRCPPGAVPCAGERDLLLELVRRVRRLDPDVLTGWNVIDFDLRVLKQVAQRCGVALELGRGPGTLRLEAGRTCRASVPGRVVLDGIQLLRGAFVAMEEYSLEHVAQRVLGQGKLVHGPGRFEEIQRLYRQDLRAFCAYNLTDARLVLEILGKLRLLELTVARSRLTGMPLDRVSASVASVDFLYLSALHRRGVVAPSHRDDDPEVPTEGGHVLEPEPGLYRNVVACDFKSLYPSLIRTFQIDPLGHVPAGRGAASADLIRAPNGAAFRRSPGILTELLDELFLSREQAKAARDDVRSHAIKILMNSFYGVLGTPACRFHSPELANAITSFGREILLWTKAQVERGGRRVLYGDTDSLFVLAGEEDPQAALRLGERLVAQLNGELAAHLRAAYGVESRLELELDRLYLRLFLPHLRGGEKGARKRYAGLALEPEGPQLVFVGLEVVRRDWTQFAREVQRALYERLFTDQPVEGYLRQVVADLRAGRCDELLVYRKALRKELGEYTASTPPHVAAARKMARQGGRLIAYVMTRAGPEPAAERRHPVDHEHYVQKQVRPVAEPVLQLLGLDFDRVIGDDRQLWLF